MRKRIFMLMALALMVGASMALSGVAQAASPKARCQQEAETLTGSILTGYNVVVGNNRKADDFTLKGTEGADVFCGRGGNDFVRDLATPDIFIGGAGNDSVNFVDGIFYGGLGDDRVAASNLGTFNGGDGDDSVNFNFGFFDGGFGFDTITENRAAGTYSSVEVVGP